MLEQLLQFDRNLFFLINQGLHNNFFDVLMPLLRSKYFWVPLYIFIITFFLKNFGWKGLYLVGFTLLTFALTDFISAGLFKPVFQRLRPCNDPVLVAYVRNIVGCGSGFSFVSSHAANHMGIAVFVGSLFSKWGYGWIRFLFLLWAVSICYAQVYIGVHYPLDVFAGAILGALTGSLLFHIKEYYLSEL